ncbi:AtpZ/AtpI family protein [Candidatus Nomurabacteria bacterium]|nr:AtpZ/AtpI family protein [Candidatus Nomurabacteria bacterium]
MSFFSKDNKQEDKELMRLGLTAFAEMSGWIAFPIIGALFLGRFLDQKYETGYLYFLSLTALAFIISMIGIGLVGMKYLKQINKEDKLQKESKEDKINDSRR